MYLIKKIIPWLICFCFFISYAHAVGDSVSQEHKAKINFEVNLSELEPDHPDSAIVIKVENKLAPKEKPKNLYIYLYITGRTGDEIEIEPELSYPLSQYIEKPLEHPYWFSTISLKQTEWNISGASFVLTRNQYRKII